MVNTEYSPTFHLDRLAVATRLVFQGDTTREVLRPLQLVIDSATKMAEAIERENPLGWVTGWNMPGYLPESEPEVHATWKEAVESLAGDIDRFADDETDSMYNPEGYHAWVGFRRNLLDTATVDQPWGDYTQDMKWSFWLVREGGDV